ncbi:MAG TPA: ATP-binding cassette domain-containing protein [Bacteroidales bacterium]|nr:ATP-binding cassette domain-containing protein [Bacteroidales bacterium]
MEDNQDIINENELKSVSQAFETPQAATSNAVTQETVIVLKEVDIYQKKFLILPKISLTIKQGELVYLIGKSGTGKSSIMKLLIADEKANGLEAKIAGFDLKKIKTKQIPYLRRKLGVVFQDYQLLADKTVIENLMLMMRASGWKNKNEMLQRAEDVLEMVGLETKDFKYPHQLSGGEQQRVCIARALLNNPEVILADEPTGNLDPITSQEIFKLFMEINKKGTTVLIATHDFMMINEFPSRTVLIENVSLIDSML